MLYDRFETDEHTIIRYSRFLPGVALILVVMLVLLVLVQNVIAAIVAYTATLVMISREMRPVRAELVAAQQAGVLTRSGHRLSLRNPLTYYIQKKPARGKRKPKRKR